MTEGRMTKCLECHGTGWIWIGPTFINPNGEEEPCPACLGTGEVYNYFYSPECQICHKPISQEEDDAAGVCTDCYFGETK